MGKCVIGKNSITCYRGTPLAKMNIVVKDKQGNEWYCSCTKEQFEIFPDKRSVEVYDRGTNQHKKFLKEFLTFERVF